MRPFEYVAAKTLKEALDVLSRHKGDVRILAGGTDLIAQMQEERRRPMVVLDGKAIPELNRLEYVKGEGMHIGAAVSCSTIRGHEAVSRMYGAIAESCGLVGSIQIQNRATIGGNLCNAAPSGDTIPPLLVHEARVVIRGHRGAREVPVEEFFSGPGQTVLAPEEMVVEMVVPPPPESSASHYLRFIPRAEMDIAVAGVACLLTLSGKARLCRRARIALAAVAPTPVRAREAEGVLEGKVISAKEVALAGERAVLAAKPITDIRGSIEYRKELIKVLTRRTLERCLQGLTDGGGNG